MSPPNWGAPWEWGAQPPTSSISSHGDAAATGILLQEQVSTSPALPGLCEAENPVPLVGFKMGFSAGVGR